MPEPIESQYFKVGRIVNTRGRDGSVIIVPEVNVPHIFEADELVRLQNDAGNLIPARIESARVQNKENRPSVLVKFSHVEDDNQARKLRRWPVLVDRAKIDEIQADQSLNRLTSYTVRSEDGKEAGIVEDVLDNPAHPIFVVHWDGKDILVPFVDEYIIDIDEDEEIIYCRKLNQLADIA